MPCILCTIYSHRLRLSFLSLFPPLLPYTTVRRSKALPMSLNLLYLGALDLGSPKNADLCVLLCFCLGLRSLYVNLTQLNSAYRPVALCRQSGATLLLVLAHVGAALVLAFQIAVMLMVYDEPTPINVIVQTFDSATIH